MTQSSLDNDARQNGAVNQDAVNQDNGQEVPAGHFARAVENGYLDHWLLAGPYPEPDTGTDADFMAWQPAEGNGPSEAKPDSRRGLWQAVPCMEDHLLHLDVRGGAAAEADSKAHAWLFAVVDSEQSGAARLTVTHTQKMVIWVNGTRHELSPVASDRPSIGGALPAAAVTVQLEAGPNPVWIYSETVQPGRWLVGAQLAGEGALRILLPTALDPVERREKLAAIGAEAYLEQDVFQAKARIWVKWPATSQLYDNLTIRLQAPNRRIYAEGYIEARAGAKIPVTYPEQLSDGRYDVVLMPKPEEYFEKKMRIAHRIPLYAVRTAHSSVYYGDYSGRAQEALVDAAKRTGLFAQIARMRLGMWDKVEGAAIADALAAVQQHSPGWRWTALGLMGMHLRFGGVGEYATGPGVAVEAAWQELMASVTDAPLPESLREDDTLAALTLAFLAQQTQILADAGDNAGADRAPDMSASVEPLVAWLTARARGGFALWDAPPAYARMIAALSHLVELGQHVDVVDLAAVLLDKLFLAMGVNSYLGVFGGAHGETVAQAIVNPGMDATSGLTRLAWGKGTYNGHLLGTVSLACAQVYSVPEIIAATAVDESSPMVSHERHAAGGLGRPEDEIHKTTHRTATGMLSAALDYRAGQAGGAEHIWQATLGADAVVFVNHPTCAADGPPVAEPGAPDRGPGFWRGNGALPRVAQAENLLMAWYRLPAGDRMGFTHAYFPCYAFDEYAITDQWAFARKGSGYIALYASTGLTRVLHGNGAYRELRAGGGAGGGTEGTEVFWLCRVGSATEDGSFQDFRAAAEAAVITTTPAANPSVTAGGMAQVTNAWGKDLTFGWEGPLRVGEHGQTLNEVPLRHSAHYAGTYAQAAFPADTLEVDYQGHGLRLTFAPVPEN